MGRRLGILFLLICTAVLLSACSLRSGDDLYALPKTSVEYESLRNALQELLDSGMEYAAPLSGSNTQPVQDVDLDGDGIGEAVAFFKDGSGLQVYVFRQNADGEYEEMTRIAGQGIAVNSAAYPQLDGEGNRDIALSWQISSGVYAISAYSVWTGGNAELLEPRNYTRYAVIDLDADGQDEIILLHLDASDLSGNRAEYYTYRDGGLSIQSEAYLSSDLATIDRARSSTLYGGENALYVTGYVTDPETGEASTRFQLTDVLALRSGGLVNVTRDEGAGSSVSTRRRVYVADQDLNGDGVWEVPDITGLYDRLDGGEVCVSDTFYLVTWYQYDMDGGRHALCNTYYNSSDGWYLVVPDSWLNSVAVSRSDYNEGITAERSIRFYALQTVDPTVESRLEENEALGVTVLTNTTAELFMTLYKNAGADQLTRSIQDGRTKLDTDTDGITYSVRLEDGDWNRWLPADVQEALHVITTNWFSD